MSKRRSRRLPNQLNKLFCFRRSRQFHLFSELSDDIQLHILSYIADAPFENISNTSLLQGTKNTGALTHTLPLVCWKFYELCQTEVLWQQVFQRAVNSDRIWHRAHKRYMDAHEEWREFAKGYLRTHLIGAVNKYFYQQVLREIRFTGPVFILRMRTLPHYGMNFFEPRYRLMMIELMEKLPLSARRGAEITEPVMFIHAHQGLPVTKKSVALLVRIERCQMGAHGHSHVDLQVVATVVLERVWVRPGSGGLHYAQTLRIRER